MAVQMTLQDADMISIWRHTATHPKKYPCALCIYVFFIIDNNCIITVINSHQLLFLLG